jgi:type I restriction enzyme S subunit
MRVELGVLPNSWSIRPLSECAEKPDYGFTASAAREQLGPKFLRITDIQEGKVDWDSVPYCSLPTTVNEDKVLHPGDIVVARIGATTGKAFLIGECPRAIFASYLIRIRAIENILTSEFLYYFLHTDFYWNHIDKHKDDRLKGGVNIPALTSIDVPVPPLSEQALITKVLRLVQKAIALEGNAEQVAQELKRASLREMMTRGLRGEAQKETEIGLVPESWKPRTILEVCEILSGGTPRKSVPKYWIGKIPWASGKDLKVPTLHDTIDHVSENGIDAGSRLAPADTVFILVRGMGLAKDLPVSVISRPMAFNQDLKALVSRGEFSGTFIRSAIYCAKDRLLSRIVPSAHGTMTLNLDDIETFKIPCPSDRNEADDIVAILDALDRKIDLHQRKRALLVDLFTAMLHKLMTAEIRVADLDLSALGQAAHEGIAA